jgi:predicted tellurium resistance membrane protein TerC
MWEIVIGVLTLTFMEIVLGIDNIIFIAIIADKLPRNEQPKARRIGLMFALVARIILLLSITTIMKLKEPLFTISFTEEPIDMSWKDLILLAGGIFLLAKSTLEIHEKTTGKEGEKKAKSGNTLTKIIIQIVLIDIVFSFDSILTAIALVDSVWIMIAAVVISMGIMMFFSGPVADFINKQPTIQILALSFLILIGFMLTVEAFHIEVPKSYLYFAVGFSLVVEMINMRVRKNT